LEAGGGVVCIKFAVEDVEDKEDEEDDDDEGGDEGDDEFAIEVD
jgi:hypothetical protein